MIREKGRLLSAKYRAWAKINESNILKNLFDVLFVHSEHNYSVKYKGRTKELLEARSGLCNLGATAHTAGKIRPIQSLDGPGVVVKVRVRRDELAILLINVEYVQFYGFWSSIIQRIANFFRYAQKIWKVEEDHQVLTRGVRTEVSYPSYSKHPVIVVHVRRASRANA